jgi:hypothetical protein
MLDERFMNGYQLDKNHKLTLCRFDDLDKYARVPDEYAPLQAQAFKDQVGELGTAAARATTWDDSRVGRGVAWRRGAALCAVRCRGPQGGLYMERAGSVRRVAWPPSSPWQARSGRRRGGCSSVRFAQSGAESAASATAAGHATAMQPWTRGVIIWRLGRQPAAPRPPRVGSQRSRGTGRP